MAGHIVLYVSRRTQRLMVALLGLVLAHTLVASCTPEPVSPMAARIDVRHG